MRVNWLRDFGEAADYPEHIIVLALHNHYGIAAYKIKKMTNEAILNECDEILGWMPVDCDHYNQWKAEREQVCPECEGAKGEYRCFDCYGMPFSPSWTKCPVCNGTGTVDKKED